MNKIGVFRAGPFFINRNLLSFFKAPMNRQKRLHFAEFPFQQIGRILDTRVGKTLAGKHNHGRCRFRLL
ncbi:hypothetical protein HMPREF9080_00280 [Cardiobacterium valvarum F0432]|uniref:Uncharacterized protein n=1 Tax=Cardiobacterium valvarum F0432 TaxID=797473 RepID=G9ZC03_9GAMM|nr:hypothetical protein HMPREF9080_00280 [Cardiobacterium valvarum F0432]